MQKGASSTSASCSRLRAGWPLAQSLSACIACAQVFMTMSIGALRAKLAPATLPMPAEDLLKARRHKCQQLISSLAHLFICLVHHLRLQRCFLHCRTRCLRIVLKERTAVAAAVHQQLKSLEPVELQGASRGESHRSHHADDGARSHGLPDHPRIFEESRQEQDAHVLHPSVIGVAFHHGQDLIESPSAQKGRSGLRAAGQAASNCSSCSGNGDLLLVLLHEVHQGTWQLRGCK
mmetsp:Transcript_2952/g.5094  ORF Transcript_2952/g.5094 Transcript_2952/m.5094 type:complete len:234 (-) Transcript_2952:456-1157(-)